MSDLTEELRQRLDKRTNGRVLNRLLGVENLKRHSFENTMTGNTMGNASVRSGSVEDSRLNGGKPTLIPFLYKGREVSAREAADLAVASGKVWPLFADNDKATAASKKISARLGNKQ